MVVTTLETSPDTDTVTDTINATNTINNTIDYTINDTINITNTIIDDSITDSITDTISKPEELKVVCYFTNWGYYRQGRGKYSPRDIDPSLCTHINYGFAVLDPTSLTMVPHDDWTDIKNQFYSQLVELRTSGVKVLLALGGWNDSEGDKYSRLVASRENIQTFVETTVDFLAEWGFDGLDLDWEYPVCWQVDCSRGPPQDREGFSQLLTQLSAAFRPRGLLLSAAVSPSQAVIDRAYDVPVLNTSLDIINVMTYDYHGYWDSVTGHISPLLQSEEESSDQFNTEDSLEYWVSLGAARSKLVMGLPLYGQTFTLADTNQTGLNSPVLGRGEPGQFTRAGGFLAYYEICQKIQEEGWTKEVSGSGEHQGPFAFSGDQWVGYDDQGMVERKAEYIKEKQYGGAMVWALDLDDFSNLCGCGEYPLLKTINSVLRDFPAKPPQCWQQQTKDKPETLTIEVSQV